MSFLSSASARQSAAGFGAATVLVGAFFLGSGHGGGSRAIAAAPVTTVPGPSVAVDGVGHIAGTPDVLKLDLGVEGRADTVSAALDVASTALTKVRDSLRAHGVAPADLQTSQLSVHANYDYSKDRQVLRGYVATESLTARLHRLSTAGQIITDAVAAGGSAVRVNGIALDIDSDAALVARARERAFAAARAKAQQYAKAAGRPLGAVTNVSETLTPARPQVLDGAAYAAPAARAAAVPVEPGSSEVSVRVTVVWALR
ncbi:MAG: SIMPL domain-containing protein [Mycobacteriales bacterium]